MVRMFGSNLPREFERLTRSVGPLHDVRENVGPFVYGFSYISEPGREPIFREFGNVRPSDRGLTVMAGRTPMIDVKDRGDHYEIHVELPGVDKSKINLDFYEDSFVVDTSGDRRFHGRMVLKDPIDLNTARASYKDGILDIRVDKTAEYKTSASIGTKVSVE